MLRKSIVLSCLLSLLFIANISCAKQQNPSVTGEEPETEEHMGGYVMKSKMPRIYSAVVMDMTGNATVQRGGKGEQVSLNAGDVLYAGDIVAVAEKSTLTINYLKTNREEKWPGGMKFSVGDSGTKDVPPGVEVSTDEVILPQGQSGEHMGGYVVYEAVGVGVEAPPPPPAIEIQGTTSDAQEGNE